MASPDDDGGLPSPALPRSEHRGPGSVISSRMTDVASDDGREGTTPQPSVASQPRSPVATSRPSTARTGVSAKGLAGRKGYASGLSAHRASGTPSPGGSAITSRSHVPSLTSNAFFRPMSSQKLQAQRGAGRQPAPSPLPLPQEEDLDDDATDFGANVMAQTPPATNPVAHFQPRRSTENVPLPPSRGTEGTEHETYGRVTANTSPTQGHAPTTSASDSVRPLHRSEQRNNMSVNVDRGRKDLINMPSPIKSPRSFRSSFLMPGKSDQEQSRNRSTEGAEKLSSEVSSPQMNAFDQQARAQGQPTKSQQRKMGHVHEYFDGNTRFFFGGRWQNTDQRPINIATGVFAVLPCILFFIFEAPWLWHNISPAIPIVFAYLTYVCMSSFIHASVSDPGVSCSQTGTLKSVRMLTCCRSYRVICTGSRPWRTTIP